MKNNKIVPQIFVYLPDFLSNMKKINNTIVAAVKILKKYSFNKK
jgi:hypothetical protein